MNKEIKNWLLMVDYDLKSANHMLKSGRYIYVIFMCHMALEKMLKALVCAQTKKVPPRIHDLIRLMEIGKVQIPQEYLDFMGIINNVNVVTRYPEDFSELVSNYPKKVSAEYLEKTKGVIRCLKRDKRLK
ncbi:MAG: HEPN domain-containing protein [Candidatus Omnitrophica bacterium]|nr:HEPN domain-containing protein [Candidatus Omnitrophota bacterium]